MRSILLATVLCWGCGDPTPEQQEMWTFTVVEAVISPQVTPHDFSQPRTRAIVDGHQSGEETGWSPRWECGATTTRSDLVRYGVRVTIVMSDSGDERVLANAPWTFPDVKEIFHNYTVSDPTPWGMLAGITTRMTRAK